MSGRKRKPNTTNLIPHTSKPQLDVHHLEMTCGRVGWVFYYSRADRFAIGRVGCMGKAKAHQSSLMHTNTHTPDMATT